MEIAQKLINTSDQSTIGANPSAVAQKYGVVLVGVGHPLREKAEAYIKRVYRRAFSAQVSQFSAQLLVKLDSRQRVIGVVGLTQGGPEPLFIEQYLGLPVEQQLTRAVDQADRPVSREQVVEIGNLAMLDRCTVPQMIRFLSEYLLEQKIDWVVFTARAEILNSFGRLDLPLLELAEASVSKLKVGADEWGSYYERAPKVVAGRVTDALALRAPSTAVARRLQPKLQPQQPRLRSLWPVSGYALPAPAAAPMQ